MGFMNINLLTMKAFASSMLSIVTATAVVFAFSVTFVTAKTSTIETVEVPTTLSTIDSLSVEADAFKSASTYTFTQCNISVDTREVVSGDEVTVSWTSTGLSSITINGETVAGTNGSKTYTVTDNTVFKLVGTSDYGLSCKAEVYVKCVPPVVPKYCELHLTKAVDKHAASVGETLTYTVTIKNTGTSDCTGGGVKIEDTLDGKLQFLSQSTSHNLSAGYEGKGVYTASDRTLRFNGHTLTPGEEGTITFTAKVITPSTCGDFEIPNKAKATAKELQNFQNWAYSNTVKTDVNNDCVEIPVPPQCPIAPAPGRTIVNFGTNLQLRSDIANQHRSTIFPATITAGEYDVRLVSWDGYVGRVNASQPNERYFVEFMNGSTVVSTSNSLADLADNVIQATKNEQVNNALTIAAATGVRAVHTVAGDNSSPNSLFPICMAIDEKPKNPVPSCDSFTAAPATITVGQSAVLAWDTTNATRVVINNGIGEVAGDGSVSVTPLASTTYAMTVFGTNNQTAHCEVPVTVVEKDVPLCEAFTATPATVPFAGGTTTLAWSVKNATNVSITPTIGTVGLVGSQGVFVTTNTTFILTATDASGDQVTCPAVVTREPAQEVFTCENNVTFSAANNSIRRGEATTLTWNVLNADSVSISTINATSFSGSQSVSPNDSLTYTLTATKGSTTVNCPVPVTVTTGGGGGGGGSSSPRCELTISDKTITRGDKITLRWDTTRATEITIKDDRGNVVVTTENKLAKDKEDFFDGSITLTPTRNTTYTLVAERGSRDVDCSVKVEMDDDIVILETRDQQPLVAGISLSSVPYTGFEAGPFMTFMFYALLVAWALYISYLIVLRKRTAAVPATITPNVVSMKQAETVRPDLFVASVATPVNLPTGTPVIGYENAVVSPHQATVDTVTELENRAHDQKALLSSDAIRHFIATTEGSLERNAALDAVIAEAKKSYPLEDGWIVINESRMRSLCTTCQVDTAAQETTFAPATVPQGTGSLAEAVVTGNIIAAYEMIGNRPMFALADAAADLDAVYRNRRGDSKVISDLLARESANLSDETIKNMITALTSALDGTYTDEASAVKMAIMKAVKELH